MNSKTQEISTVPPGLMRGGEQASSERPTKRDGEWTPFNINRRVRVKLTDKGRHYLCEEHIKFWAEAGRPMEYRAPKEDADGWSEWQLWDLMNRLGGACTMGFRIPFETTIEFER